MADENETPSWLTETPPAPVVAEPVPVAAPAPASTTPRNLPAVKMTDASAAAASSNSTELTGEIFKLQNYISCNYSVHTFFDKQWLVRIIF